MDGYDTCRPAHHNYGGKHVVGEPVRLICPVCGQVHRVKRLTIGKPYQCKKCGAGLVTLEPAAPACPHCGHTPEPDIIDPAVPYACGECGQPSSPIIGLPPAPADRAGGHGDGETAIASMNLAAASSTSNIAAAIPSDDAGARPRGAGTADGTPSPGMARLEREFETQLNRLFAISDNLAARLDMLRDTDVAAVAGELAETAGQLRDSASRLETGMAEHAETLSEKAAELGERAAALASGAGQESLDAIAALIRETGAAMSARFDELKTERGAELSIATLPAADGQAAQAAALDLDALAERIAGAIRSARPHLGQEGGDAVDALARLADELVREQSSNSERLEHLAGEIRTAVVSISNLEEWRGDLPAKVADEIGRTVEDRVVGPISGALAKQAPEILADLQDNRLVDIVSRSVREAQRPLIREILLRGQRGVPVWLFAAVMLPLLFVLGYLFWASESEFDEWRQSAAAQNEELSQKIAMLRESGLPLKPESQELLVRITEVLDDIEVDAMESARQNAGLAEQVRQKELEIQQMNKGFDEYNKVIEQTTKQLRAYRDRLIRLGVNPDSLTTE